jgi:hypothetical protein
MDISNLECITDAELGRVFRAFLNGSLVKGQGPVDFDLLHRQKMCINEYSPALPPQEQEYFDGLVNFLDSFQDMFVDNLRIWEFPEG